MIKTDIVVVGLGAMGAAALYQLARRGVACVGIDRFDPPHDSGSSHGETRITRCAVGEGADYVPFVQRSHTIWRELEQETGDALFDACGLLMMAPRGVRTGHHGKTDFLNRTISVAREHDIPHELLDGAAVASRFPGFLTQGNEEAYLEPGGGFVRPERCIAAQLRRARELGARVMTGCTVQAIQPDGHGVLIQTPQGPIQADQVVVAAGAWAGALLGGSFTPVLVPRRQVLHWFPVQDAAAFASSNFPAYIWMHGAQPEDYFYGFPALPGTAEVKVASEQYVDACDPDTVDRTVSTAESAATFSAHIEGRLRGASATPSRGAVCLYTVTPDSGFVIDRHPDTDRITVLSPCSGHGFKHSAGIGAAVAEWIVDGRSSIDLRPFRLDRLRTSPALHEAMPA